MKQSIPLIHTLLTKRWAALLPSFLLLHFAHAEEKNDEATISVRISNFADKEIHVRNFDGTYSQDLAVSEDGAFSGKIRSSEKLILDDGKNRIYAYLESGDNLKVKYDFADQNGTIDFSGKGFEKTKLIFDDRLIIQDYFAKETIALLEEKAFKKRWAEITNSREELLKNTANLSDEFKGLQKRHIRYFYLERLPTYGPKHAMFTRNEDFEVSEGFMDEFKALDEFSRPGDYLFSGPYRRIACMHYAGLVNDVENPNTIPWGLLALQVLSQLEIDEVIKNGLLLDYAKTYLNQDTRNPQLYYETFMKASTNEKHKTIITNRFKSLDVFVDGKPSPKFVDYENSSGGTTSLDDLKGKYVYIDVWATWCGPCLAEIPHSKKVMAKYENKKIAFVGLSVDQDKEKWRKAVADKKLGGLQLIADKQLESEFVRSYGIKGIPRFILIDPEGKIVRKEAPRPSDPRLHELFDSLEIQ